MPKTSVAREGLKTHYQITAVIIIN